MLMAESSMCACALPNVPSDQTVRLIEHKHIYLIPPSTSLLKDRPVPLCLTMFVSYIGCVYDE
jgi:hypothetical protein